jgi:hypothetical protein
LCPRGTFTCLKVLQAADPNERCPLTPIRWMLGDPRVECIKPDDEAIRYNGS